jgi:hypothetical protein
MVTGGWLDPLVSAHTTTTKWVFFYCLQVLAPELIRLLTPDLAQGSN